jgi:NDP-sugar pyrophosphorylase family protein
MSKERLTITLDRRILDEVDATIDGINVRNRSHAIEKLIEVALSQNVSQKAVILAGGNTIRQNGKIIPKPMVNVAGKPIIEYTIQMLVRNGVNDFIILAGEKGEEITSYLGDGSRFGAKITYLIEEKRKGTEGALLFAKGLIGNWPFFVVNGDNFYDFRVSEMYKQHIATKALVTIALTTAESTKGFGVTKLEGSKILGFVEKPYSENSKLISTGFYIFSKEALGLIDPSSEPSMLEKSLFPKLAKMGKLHGFVIYGKWSPLIDNELEQSIKEMEKLSKTK